MMLRRRRNPDSEPRLTTETKASEPSASDANDPNVPTAENPSGGDASSPATMDATASGAVPPKGDGMSSLTTQKSGSGGFVPEIPRRSSIDLPGAPNRRGARGPAATTESKKLIVGREISLAGEITACDSLVVEGSVQATLKNSQHIEITDTGFFKGDVTIDDAEIAGRFEGALQVRGRLLVKSTGRISGEISFGRLEVELGGEIEGTISVLNTADSDTDRADA